DDLGTDLAVGARPVVDHDLLAECLAELLAEGARHDVGDAAGRIGNHDADRLGRIRLSRGAWERDGAEHREPRDRTPYATRAPCPSRRHVIPRLSRPRAISPLWTKTACR